VPVADDLRVAGAPHVFAAGDAAAAVTDDAGHHTLMACQHALMTGRYAGHYAACDLLGLPTMAYRQPSYVTCLDLGGWGAVFTQGCQRDVAMAGADAKALKTRINSDWIYPPVPQRELLLAAADAEAAFGR
jgi:NADH:ubiquinone reductase (H+-translocating)